MNDDTLSLSHVSACYNGKTILDDAEISVEKGCLTCLLGRNGAGKTTLLKILASLPPENLTVKQNGTILKNRSIDRMQQARKVAFVSQSEYSLWNYPVIDMVLQGRFCHTSSTGLLTKEDYDAAENALERLHISDLRNAGVHELSGGEFQKVRLARCLAQDTPFILLDEPLANLDFSYEAEFINLLKELTQKENRGILMTVHDINAASRYGDILAVITSKKKVIRGTPQQIITPEIIQDAFGKKITVFTHPDGSLQIY